MSGLGLVADFDVLTPARAAVASWIRPTPGGQYLGAMMAEGFWSSLPGQGIAAFRVPDDDVAVVATRGGPVRVREQAAPVMSKFEWTRSPWYREGLPFDDRMSEGRAAALARIYDENLYRRQLIARGPEGFGWRALGFGAALVGSLPDPVNYVPIFGPAFRAAAVARAGRVMGNVLTSAGEAAIGTAATEPFILGGRRNFGDDVGWADAVMDIAMAATIGAGLGGLHSAFSWRASRRAAIGDQAAALDRLDLAARDLAAQRPLDMQATVRREQAQLIAGRHRVQNELAALRADPSRVPLPAVEVIATMTPETIGEVLMRRGQVFHSRGGLVIAKRGTEGFIKLEFRHPDVTDAELANMPVVLRDRLPARAQEFSGTTVIDYRATMDGVQVTYRLKVPTKGKDAGKRLVATIFRETDPNNFKPESPERVAGGGGIPGKEGSLSSQDTARAFSSSVTREPTNLPAARNIGPGGVNEKAPLGAEVAGRTDTTVRPDTPAPDGLEAAAARISTPADPRLEAMAAEHGVNPETGDFDEAGALRAIEAEGRLTPEETAALRQADETLARAKDYAAGYEAAAVCLSRKS